MSTRSYWLGLDIGGTRIKGGIVDDRGRVQLRDIQSTDPAANPKKFEQQLLTLIKRLTSKRSHKPLGIGLAITGPVDPKRGCVYLPGKIKSLANHPTVPFLQKATLLPVLADNDGRLACYGEWKAGAAVGVDNLLVITMGTGIGSGVVLDGRLLTDRHLQRGTQCGHFVIDISGPRCLTGAAGTGESVASITALVHEVRTHLARGVPLDLPPDPDFAAITAALKRDPVLRDIFNRWLDRFTAVLLNAFYAYTPDLILLAGGPTKSASAFLPHLRHRLNHVAFRYPPRYAIRITTAKLGEDAGWIGAALRMRDHVHEEAA